MTLQQAEKNLTQARKNLATGHSLLEQANSVIDTAIRLLETETDTDRRMTLSTTLATTRMALTVIVEQLEQDEQTEKACLVDLERYQRRQSEIEKALYERATATLQ